MPALFERAEGWEEGELGRSIDAVAIDSRDRTKSKGYVLPVMFEESMTELGIWRKHAQTEVIPANAPLSSLVGVSSSLLP